MEAICTKLKKNHEWKAFLVKAKKDFLERMNATEHHKATINDFYYIKTIGKGHANEFSLVKEVEVTISTSRQKPSDEIEISRK
ncbi:uncharacterized protein isoform X1 [Rhodnius prolixus]|uniref:uncharacterized protein isoform X1 n=1 Tax=Rhodnius prolixus TaxID=13249 RepID=UPI003D18A744